RFEEEQLARQDHFLAIELPGRLEELFAQSQVHGGFSGRDERPRVEPAARVPDGAQVRLDLVLNGQRSPDFDLEVIPLGRTRLSALGPGRRSQETNGREEQDWHRSHELILHGAVVQPKRREVYPPCPKYGEQGRTAAGTADRPLLD